MNYFRYKTSYLNLEYDFIIKCKDPGAFKRFHGISAEITKIVKAPRFTNFIIGGNYSFDKKLLQPIINPNDILKDLI